MITPENFAQAERMAREHGMTAYQDPLRLVFQMHSRIGFGAIQARVNQADGMFGWYVEVDAGGTRRQRIIMSYFGGLEVAIQAAIDAILAVDAAHRLEEW